MRLVDLLANSPFSEEERRRYEYHLSDLKDIAENLLKGFRRLEEAETEAAAASACLDLWSELYQHLVEVHLGPCLQVLDTLSLDAPDITEETGSDAAQAGPDKTR